jgi:hypothetical protein
MLNVIDEYTRECLAIDVARKLKADDVLERPSDLFVRRGVPRHIRSDNGPEFTARAVRGWLDRVGVKTLFIEPGSPWENGYIESFNGKLSDELLDGEVFDTLLEAKVLIERYRVRYNHVSYCHTSLCAGKAERLLVGSRFRGGSRPVVSPSDKVLGRCGLQLSTVDDPGAVRQRVLSRDLAALDR